MDIFYVYLFFVYLVGVLIALTIIAFVKARVQEDIDELTSLDPVLAILSWVLPLLMIMIYIACLVISSFSKYYKNCYEWFRKRTSLKQY